MAIRHFLSADQVNEEFSLELIERAEAFKHGAEPHIELPKYAANLFFENSTRTHTSFEMAERKLGMTVIPFNPETSSVSKGETLEDTVKTLSAIGVDLVVIRHSEDAYYEELNTPENQAISIVNAGDGAGQHPSQMMLDLMTIHEEFGKFSGLKVGIVGDLEHSRVARSDMEILKRLGSQIFFSGPKEWYTKDFESYGPYVELKELVKEVDVLMLLRVQLERLHSDEKSEFSKEEYHQTYGLTDELAGLMKDEAIIMHPAPVNRDVELASDLVECEKSRIFPQMKNGMFMRMAMLEWTLNCEDK